MRKAAGVAGWSSFAIALGALLPMASAQLTEFTYSGGTGAQAWQSAANWGGSGFPNDPNHVANLSTALGGSLSIDVGSTGNDVTVAGIKIGGTSGAVTTNITSSGAMLRIQNDFVQALANADFSNNGIVDGADFLIWQRNLGATNQENSFGGDADLNTVVEAADLVIWKDNYGLSANGLNSGRGQIITSNVAGSINQISAPVRLVNELVDVLGQSNLTISGAISFQNVNPQTNVLDSSISNTSAGITTTLSGPINLRNQDMNTAGLLGLNTSGAATGTLIVDGVMSDEGAGSGIQIGIPGNGVPLPLNTVIINQANTLSGSVRFSRSNIVLNNGAALGTGTIRQVGPANQFGYNLVAGGGGLNEQGQLVIANNMVIAQFQTFKGEHSVKMTGTITQTNNRGIVNLIAPDKSLEFSGTVNIWEDPFDALDRRLVFDGTGTTVISGTIQDADPSLGTGEPRSIVKTGTGTLRFNTAANGVNHGGAMVVNMGQVHYATNDSLNVGGGLIRSTGGAVGVDTGVANNSALNAKIDPTSTGGLMLAPSDAAATIDFTTTLNNAGKMTVAAPAAGMTFTGTIVPANSTYGLGGGTGKLTLPNAQLSGNNAVEIRNGGTVELLGDNTYTGATRIMTKYASTNQDRAAADNAGNISSLYYKQVAPTLVVDDLANGGVASSIGAASSDAANLYIQGGTLKYVGTGDTTNRLFTIGTGGGTIDSSGTGAVVFSNTGLVGAADAASRYGLLNDLQQNPNVIYDVADTTDIIIGMPVSDPGPPTSAGLTTGCGPGGTNCIVAGTTVTGIDGTQVGLSQNTVLGIYKPATIVYGAVPRTFTLSGTNTADNTIASAIGNSAAGSVVTVEKTGSGKWVLSGANTYTGRTIVREGILSVTNPVLTDSSVVELLTGGVLNLNFAGTDIVGGLIINGTTMQTGIWGAPGSGAAFTTPLLSGTGLLNVGGMALEAIAAVPEPAALGLAALAVLGLLQSRRRRANG